MDTIFMDSENGKNSKPHVLILKFTNKLNCRRDEKVLFYQIFLFTIHGKT